MKINLDATLIEARKRYLQDAPDAELRESSLAQMRAAHAQRSPGIRPKRFAWFAGGGVIAATLAVALLALSSQAGAARQNATPYVYAQGADKNSAVAQVQTMDVSREAMVDFGFPVPLERMHETVRAEVLLGADGRAIALRFIEPTAPERTTPSVMTVF
jgi:hypothetical protein